jgi:hypothetical protein
MNILPPILSFNFGPEDNKLEIQCEYTDKQTTFRLIFNGRTGEQVFYNIFGQPTMINLLSNRDADALDTAYPNEIERIRFVKNVLYAWVAYKLGHMDLLGTFSRLFDKKKTFDDYAHKELLEIVVIPVLRSIRDGKKHLPDMPEAILVFSDIASRELEGFLINEVDKADIFEEEEFKADFKERLVQVNANLAIKAVQALSAADIDRISKIGETIEDLQSRKVDLPEFESMREEFKGLCRKIEILGNGNNNQIQVMTTNPVLDNLISEINSKKETLERDIERVRETLREIENNKPQPQVLERIERIIVQPDFSSETAQNKIMRNMNRKSLKVLDKMFNSEE